MLSSVHAWYAVEVLPEVAIPGGCTLLNDDDDDDDLSCCCCCCQDDSDDADVDAEEPEADECTLHDDIANFEVFDFER